MKFVVTGAAGHVSKPLTELLVGQGHDVTVVGRNADNLAGLVKLGAKAAIGDLNDVPFLTETFKGADGVYLMLPPSWDAKSIKQTSADLGVGFVRAIQDSDVRNVVYLSSYGAHRLDDAGAISGMGLGEVILNSLKDVNVLSLRAGYFYTNLLLSLDQIRTSGVMGNMFEIPAGTFTVVDPADIAKAAADALVGQDFSGHSFKYVVSDLTGTDEIAALIGKELGKPDLRWVRFPAPDFRNVLLGFGFAEGAADDYVEMFTALGQGVLFEDFVAGGHKPNGVSVEDFAKQFAAIYNS